MRRFTVDEELVKEASKILNGNEDLIRYLVPLFVSHIKEFDEAGAEEFGDSDWCYLFIVFLIGVSLGSTNERVTEEMNAFNILNNMETRLKQ